MKKFVYPIIILLFTSCMAFHTGTVNFTPLFSPKDRYIDVASGYACTTYFLGIGGLSKDALVYEAKTALMKNRPLKPGEYYANVTVDFKKTVCILSTASNEVFIHADVLTTNPDTSLLANGHNNFNKIENKFIPVTYVKKVGKDTFYVGENIIYCNPDEGIYEFKYFKITSFLDKEKVSLKNIEKEGEINTIINVKDLIYSMDKERNGFRYGDSVSYPSRKPFSNKIASGKIIATSVNQVVVLEGKRTFELKYQELTKINPAK